MQIGTVTCQPRGSVFKLRHCESRSSLFISLIVLLVSVGLIECQYSLRMLTVRMNLCERFNVDGSLCNLYLKPPLIEACFYKCSPNSSIS